MRPTGTHVGHDSPPQLDLDGFICACNYVQQMSVLYDRCGAGRTTPMEVSREDFLRMILNRP